MPGVTHDSGALVAAERNDRRMWALHAGFLAEEVAHDDIADVTVVESAFGRREAVVTSNEDHIRLIADTVRARLRIGSI